MRKLTNVTCGDQYTDAATLSNVIGSSGGYFNITGADVWMEIQFGIQGQTNFTDEVHIPVGGGILVQGTTGVRFRNFVAGQNAVVTAALSDKAEPPIQIASTGQAINQGRNVIPVYGIGQWPPLNPADGDIAALIPDAINFQGVRWLFQFNAGSPSANKWEFLGGPPMLASLSDATIEGLPNSLVYVPFPTNVTLTIPRTGDYDIAFGVTIAPPAGAGNDLYATPSFTGDSDSIFTTMQAAVASEFGSFERTFGPRTIAGGTIATLQYRTNAGVGNSRRSKYLSILPVRIQ